MILKPTAYVTILVLATVVIGFGATQPQSKRTNPRGEIRGVEDSPTTRGKAAVAESRPDLNQLKSFAGKDLDVLYKKRPDFQMRVKRLLGSNYTEFEEGLGVRPDLKIENGLLGVAGCVPHFCGFNGSALVIDLEDGNIYCLILSSPFDDKGKSGKKNLRMFSENDKPMPVSVKAFEDLLLEM
jgi:hypothetical protein